MRYWLYKNNRKGGPAGYWGDWKAHVFPSKSPVQWGGSYSTRSTAVWTLLDEEVAAGDVVAAYQTDDGELIGTCRVTKITGPLGSRKLWLKPIHELASPLDLHRAKIGTPLERSSALKSRVMLTELSSAEMRELAAICGVSLSRRS